MPSKNPARPILVTGLPRSGTSLVTGLLGTAGLWLGTCVPGGPANPTGFFEHVVLREQVQKPLLEKLGADPLGVKRLPRLDALPRLPALAPVVAGHLRDDGHDGRSPWGFKDAKLTLTWPCWAKAFPKASWVIVRRPEDDIIRSCLNTSFMAAHSTDPAFWRRFVDAYLERLEALKATVGDWTEVMAADAVQGRFAALRRIAEARGLAWDDEAATALIRPEAFDRHCAPAGDSTDALA